MGHTNKTARLQLPQFLGTDKPTMLGDMNVAFSKIDESFGAMRDTVDSHATKFDRFNDGTAILAALKLVDGTGSKLDADLLDGQESSAYAKAETVEGMSTAFSKLTTDFSDVNTNVSALSAQVALLASQIKHQVERPQGTVVKNGFQPVAAVDAGQPTAVTMGQLNAKNGVAYDSANGGGLRTTVAGDYLVTFSCVFSGVAGLSVANLIRWLNGSGEELSGINTGGAKNSDDFTIGKAFRTHLEAGDAITMVAKSSSNVWGNGKEGTTFISIVRL